MTLQRALIARQHGSSTNYMKTTGQGFTSAPLGFIWVLLRPHFGLVWVTVRHIKKSYKKLQKVTKTVKKSYEKLWVV